jgi:hypothetical protein
MYVCTQVCSRYLCRIQDLEYLQSGTHMSAILLSFAGQGKVQVYLFKLQTVGPGKALN